MASRYMQEVIERVRKPEMVKFNFLFFNQNFYLNYILERIFT